MTDGRTGTVVYSAGDELRSKYGTVGIEESTQVTVVRVRGSGETLVPWDRVVSIEYE